MSSTPKRFTRYDAEHHDPATEYVLATEHDAEVERYRTMSDNYCALGMDANATAEALRAERNELARLRDRLLSELEQTRAQLAALSYPVHLHTNPVLTVESGGIRYVLEVLSDEDGEWFEVKSATPTEAMDLDDFASNADYYTRTEMDARAALAAYRAAQREDDEASRAY